MGVYEKPGRVNLWGDALLVWSKYRWDENNCCSWMTLLNFSRINVNVKERMVMGRKISLPHDPLTVRGNGEDSGERTSLDIWYQQFRSKMMGGLGSVL